MTREERKTYEIFAANQEDTKREYEEAIAIGHDIGHTPFGHIGERTLNYIMNGCYDIKNINIDLDKEDKGFKHNWQGIRVVMELEEISNDYKGLNLTEYTLWGILNHSNIEYNGCGKELENRNQCSLRQSLKKCRGSEEVFSFEKELKDADDKFQKYLCNIILNSFLAQSMDGKSNFIIRQLIKAYVSNPQQLPDKTIVSLYKNYMSDIEWDEYKGKSLKTIVGKLRNRLSDDHFNKFEKGYRQVLLRTICDYIAGMTNIYAIEQFNLLYGTKHIGQM